MCRALEFCKALNGAQYKIRFEDTIRLRTAGFMTEFGANTNDKYGWECVCLSFDSLSILRVCGRLGVRVPCFIVFVS
jgi:hypothetical protein